MKQTIYKLMFAFVFAFRNLAHQFIKSLLLMISIAIMAIIILLGFSAPRFIETYYYDSMVKPFDNKEIIMTVNENTLTRYFSVRQLKETNSVNDYINKWTPVFEINSLIGFSSFNRQYVKVIASELEHFQSLNPNLNYTGSGIADSETIITKSLASKYNLDLGDSITLYIGESAKLFFIIDIVNDEGLFQNDSIFISKQASLSFFLYALNPNLVIPNPEFLTNIYNTVYFNIKSDVSTFDAIEFLKSLSDYSNLEIKETVDFAVVSQLINRSLSIYRVIIVMVFLAIIIVIQSTFMMYFESRKKSYAITNILGGEKQYSYLITLIEMLIIFIFVIVISNVGASLIMNQGLKYININQIIDIPLIDRLLSSLIVATIFIIASTVYFYQYYKNSSIVSSLDIGKEITFSQKGLYFTTLGIIISYFIVSILQFRLYQAYWLSIFKITISITLLFVLSFTLLFTIVKILQKLNIFRFFNLNFSILISKKAFYQYVTISLISLLSIFLLNLTKHHMEETIQGVQQEYKVDYALTNIISRFDETLLNVQSLDAVSDAHPALILRNVSIKENHQVISQIIAIEPNFINLYFNFDVDEEVIGLLNYDTPSIILSNRYRIIENMKVDDIIHLSIKPNQPPTPVRIIGFYENETGNIALSNLNIITGIEYIPSNTIMITEKENYFGLKDQLINLFSKNLIYVLDYNQVIGDSVNQLKVNTNYMVYMLSIMIVCFVFSIINYNFILFEDMKKIYARSIIIGSSRLQLMKQLILETFVFWTVFSITTLLVFITIANELTNVIILFGEYEAVSYKLQTIISSCIIGLIVLIISRILYIKKLYDMKLSQTLNMQTF